MVNFATICLSHDRVILMKLTIIRLQQLSEQDRSDVKKIWPQANIAALESELNEAKQLYAARFNDRLLAAVRVTLSGSAAEMQQLEVREVTRRRGVGLYLVQEVMAQNPQVAQWVVSQDGSSAQQVIAAFMQAAGFNLHAYRWIKM